MNELDRQILHDIIEGYLPPALKLNLRELSDHYGVGPTPLRESLSRLVKTQLVEKMDNRGFRVSPITEKELQDVHQTFIEIESLALRQAMEKGSDDWEANITAALYRLKKVELRSPVKYDEWAPLNDAFHRSLIQGCQSDCLLEIRENLYQRVKRYTKIAFDLHQGNLEVNHAEHNKIAAAVLKRDHKTALKLFKHHCTDSWQDLIDALKEKGAFND